MESKAVSRRRQGITSDFPLAVIAASSIQVVILAVAMGAAVAILAKNSAVTLVAAGGCGVIVSLLTFGGGGHGWLNGLSETDFGGMIFPAVVPIISAMVTRLLIVLFGSERS